MLNCKNYIAENEFKNLFSWFLDSWIEKFVPSDDICC